jgi:hypothetical protein
MYTNATASNLNFDLYSKAVGGRLRKTKRFKGGLFTPKKSGHSSKAINTCLTTCSKDAQVLCNRTCTSAVNSTIEAGPLKEHSKILSSIYSEMYDLRSKNKKLVSDNLKLQDMVEELNDEIDDISRTRSRSRRRRRR